MASRALGHHRDNGIMGSGRIMMLPARGRRRSMVPRLGNGAECIASRTQGGRCCCGLGNSIGMVPAWSTVTPAWVGEDGSA
jgi:hypothetical protein